MFVRGGTKSMNIRIASFGKIFLLLLIISGIALASVSQLVLQDSFQIKKSWDDFELQRSEKFRALIILDQSLGYGGLINDFKIFVIRQNEEDNRKFHQHLGAAMSAIQNYRNLIPSESESQSLADISDVLDKYYESAKVAEREIANGITPLELDKLVMVNDDRAIKAVNDLSRLILGESRALFPNLHDYSVLFSRLVHTAGYGGMIHHYKNYLIRGDKRYKDAALESFESLRALLLAYDSDNALPIERGAAKVILETIDLYSRQLDEITQLRDNGLSIREIDNIVQVDDAPALESLNILSRSINKRLGDEANQVSIRLDNIGQSSQNQLYIVIITFLLMFSGGIYLVWFRVTKPLGKLSNIISKLSVGDFQTEVTEVNANDEVGEIAKMLNLYKKKSLEIYKTERKIKETHTKYANILEIATDAIVSIDNNHNIIIFNSGAEACFGYEADEVMGKNISILIPESYHKNHGAQIDNFSTGNNKSRFMTDRSNIAAKRKDGSEFLGAGTISKVGKGDDSFFTIIMRDVSDTIAREEDLKQAMVNAELANRAKSEFLANMSHELRTPLNAIIGFSSILMEPSICPNDKKKYQEYSKDINDSGQHLLGLISAMLDLSKIEAGKLELNEQNIYPEDLVTSSINFVKVRASEQNIELIVENSVGDIEIDVDQRMVKQMLVNLLNNSVKFTQPGGKITICHGLCMGGEYSIKVTDTGIGIHKEHIDTVLLPFWQLDSNHQRTNEGTGLGLSLVKSLIELHGGTMSIESVLGEGTSVELFIPATRVVEAIIPKCNSI